LRLETLVLWNESTEHGNVTLLQVHEKPFFPQETIRDANPLKHVLEIGHWLVAL
jgi:hypothetical protein